MTLRIAVLLLVVFTGCTHRPPVIEPAFSWSEADSRCRTPNEYFSVPKDYADCMKRNGCYFDGCNWCCGDRHYVSCTLMGCVDSLP